MNKALQSRAGKNAALKPHPFLNVSYGPREPVELTQGGGDQLLVAGPPLPGTGQSGAGRAQDTAGQGDLGNERYMGARSRLLNAIQSAEAVIGMLYGIKGSVDGDVLFVLPNGQAYSIASLSIAAGSAMGLPVSLLGSHLFALAPGENIIFRPSGGTATDKALFVPGYVDCDVLNFHTALNDFTRTTVLEPPPGKVWQIPSAAENGVLVGAGILNLDQDGLALNHEYKLFISDGAQDIEFEDSSASSPALNPISNFGTGNSIFLMGSEEAGGIGMSLKAQLDTTAVKVPDSVLFCALVAEYNIGDDLGDVSLPGTISVVTQPG